MSAQPTLSRKDRQAETRAALLRSASRLFTERGLEGTSIEQIARDAGYTKGAFYANFASKEELFLTMLDDKFAAEIERLEFALAGEREPGEEARSASEDFIRFVWSDPDWPRLFFEFTAYASRHPDFREQLAARNQALRAQIVGVFREWSKDFPADPPLPLEDLATMTFCMANGFIVERLIEPELGEELYGTMMTTFFRGLQALALSWDPEAEAASK
ncbi:MAG: TetR/AcrR family transcriptional regulator [Solirubrobacterales bacterium]